MESKYNKGIILKDITSNKYEEILDLYHQEGWSNYTENIGYIPEMLEQSSYTIGAYEDDKLVGFIRGFSDSYSVNFIQDLIVKESHKRQGIGSLLIKKASIIYEKVRKTILITDNLESTKQFYKSCKFSASKDRQDVECFIRLN